MIHTRGYKKELLAAKQPTTNKKEGNTIHKFQEMDLKLLVLSE